MNQNLNILKNIADKWCTIPFNAKVYPFVPEWAVKWRNDDTMKYVVYSNDPQHNPGDISLAIVVSPESYELLDPGIAKIWCDLERMVFLGLMIAGEREESGARFKKSDLQWLKSYLNKNYDFLDPDQISERYLVDP